MRRGFTTLEEAFLQDLAMSRYPRSTIKVYRSALNVVRELTGVSAEAFTSIEAAALLEVDAAVDTQRMWLTAVRTFHDWLCRNGFAFDPDVREAPMPQRVRPAPRPLPPRVIGTLRNLSRAGDAEWRAFFTLVDATGLPWTQALAVNLGDALELLEQEQRGEPLMLRAGRRVFPVHELTAAWRRSAHELVPDFRRFILTARPDYDDPADALFIDRRGRRRSYGWAHTRWCELCAEAGAKAEPLQTRHTFACEEFARGADVDQVARWLNVDRANARFYSMDSRR